MGSGYPTIGIGWVGFARTLGIGWVGVPLAWVEVGLGYSLAWVGVRVGSHGPWVGVESGVPNVRVIIRCDNWLKQGSDPVATLLHKTLT
jgi:hypothetical protein